ncbi:hypothetical protein VIBNIMADA3021_1210086 [Vibrio nigripulchritudo MADA3021]|nr:hypothetical protein VIBNIMADA3021_1210086 [Vibrio nigripulchritudo MADA3021]
MGLYRTGRNSYRAASLFPPTLIDRKINHYPAFTGLDLSDENAKKKNCANVFLFFSTPVRIAPFFTSNL